MWSRRSGAELSATAAAKGYLELPRITRGRRERIETDAVFRVRSCDSRVALKKARLSHMGESCG
ncbi:MAG: hypothetical protein DMF37_06140 [Verrucomicrobia bacterium]|nr:MAG: hypothetical protein DMF37_06140 [Verrucomicrobiota bacterium]